MTIPHRQVHTATRREIKRIAARLYHLYTKENTGWLEWLSGTLAGGWGYTLCFPPPGDVQSDAGRAMERFAPLYVWGSLIAALGIVQLIGVAGDYLGIRYGVSFIAGPFWISLGFMLLLTGFPFYAAILFTCGWCYYRIATRRG